MCVHVQTMLLQETEEMVTRQHRSVLQKPRHALERMAPTFKRITFP